jgi:hypothetical protein
MLTNLKLKLAKSILKNIGYKSVLVKSNAGEQWIDGDREMFIYFDFFGYTFKKPPLKRK